MKRATAMVAALLLVGIASCSTKNEHPSSVGIAERPIDFDAEDAPPDATVYRPVYVQSCPDLADCAAKIQDLLAEGLEALTEEGQTLLVPPPGSALYLIPPPTTTEERQRRPSDAELEQWTEEILGYPVDFSSTSQGCDEQLDAEFQKLHDAIEEVQRDIGNFEARVKAREAGSK